MSQSLKYELYDFYIDHCVDEEKGELPLAFDEWEKEIYPKDIEFLKQITRGEK